MYRFTLPIALIASLSLACAHGAGKEDIPPAAAASPADQPEAAPAPSQTADHHAAPDHPIPEATSQPTSMPAHLVPKSFAEPPTAGTVAKCPVTGEVFTVGPDATRAEYQGRHYVVCCAGCMPDFQEDPSKFADKAP